MALFLNRYGHRDAFYLEAIFVAGIPFQAGSVGVFMDFQNKCAPVP
jgi:hypothetical protein